MKLEIEIGSPVEANFRIGLGYDGLELDLDSIGVEAAFKKFFKTTKIFEPNKDYLLLVKKDVENLLDPDIEDCMKYTIRVCPIDKVKILDK